MLTFFFTIVILFHRLFFPLYFTNKPFVLSVPPRAGVAVIWERRREDGPGGKPQEANRGQAHVIHQVFRADQGEGQWLWGRGLLATKPHRSNHATAAVRLHQDQPWWFNTGAETEKFSIVSAPLEERSVGGSGTHVVPQHSSSHLLLGFFSPLLKESQDSRTRIQQNLYHYITEKSLFLLLRF